VNSERSAKEALMRKACRVVLVALGLLWWIAASPALAVGPLDGAYLVTLSNPTYGTLEQAATVVQNGNQFLLISLFFDGTWAFGFGTITGNAAQGNLFLPNGVAFGNFSVMLGTTQITGESNVNGVPYTFSATKVF
jgi:hypothetical protein